MSKPLTLAQRTIQKAQKELGIFDRVGQQTSSDLIAAALQQEAELARLRDANKALTAERDDAVRWRASAVACADRLSAELAEARKTPPGWPDPLESPQAEAIRAGKIDDTSIRDLFDRMERELQQHRLQFVEQQAEIERLSKSNQIYDAIFNDKGRVLFYSESIVRRVRAARSFLASKEARQ